ncbi:citrate lyase holo-[acyl-carrier protein] synthase [Martelella alba]|uniref:citrate lyase holo-[acyl-carrier protein] synthase n=1 Tax=Martelella alba TaxID=2590451 RepID=A0ABY2SMH2_9HYPH|nr:citrate lyase holo-[acyl-carrier protein] synthase [Martelella alba]TKI06551.1 citrate lyase holo-[acyl-carrier protein] synthase [Martelella alba]
MDRDASLAHGVTLEQLLAAKECRSARQREWIRQFGHPLLSLTLVTPGPVKDTPGYRLLMNLAVTAADGMLAAGGWPVAAREIFWLPTGPEACWSVNGGGVSLKTAAVKLEQAHPLGRLWDMDVIATDARPIGRASLGRDGRRCLLCRRPAHACARSRRHPLSQLSARIEKMLEEYLVRHAV